MDWQPITEKELSLQIEEAVFQMSEEARRKFESVRAPISKVECRRGSRYGEEQLFVLCRSGNKLLLFDDVEDEFGIAVFGFQGDAPLMEWKLFSTLEQALSEL